jgi:hypothetical protein
MFFILCSFKCLKPSTANDRLGRRLCCEHSGCLATFADSGS